MPKMSEKMHTGELYLPDDAEIMKCQTKCLDPFMPITRPDRPRANAALRSCGKCLPRLERIVTSSRRFMRISAVHTSISGKTSMRILI